MTYLEKIDQREIDKKKVVSARVSEDVLSALNRAEKDADLFGYTFSATKVIEKALNDTLLEIKDTTGIDYYKLVKWQKKMIQQYKSFLANIDTRKEKETYEVQLAVNFQQDVFTDYSYLPKPNLSASDSVSHSQQGVSPETLKKMKQGKISHTPSIELHGQKIEEACESLSHFIHDHDDECFIHIIHGKGHHLDEGLSILKSQVIHYLKQHPRVLAFCSCPQNMGGTGAVFAYIKNNIDFDVINSRQWMHWFIGSVSESNFDSRIREVENEFIEDWNMALKSQDSTCRIKSEKTELWGNDMSFYNYGQEELNIIDNSNKRSESDE